MTTSDHDRGGEEQGGARIPVDRSTRDRVRSLKRGGETYDDLLNAMADQYDPDAGEGGGS